MLFSIVVVPIYIPTLLSTSTPAFVISSLFDNSYFNRCEMISYSGFNLHFPNDCDVEHVFIYFLAFCRKDLSVLIFNMVNTERCDPHEQKNLLGVMNNLIL